MEKEKTIPMPVANEHAAGIDLRHGSCPTNHIRFISFIRKCNVCRQRQERLNKDSATFGRKDTTDSGGCLREHWVLRILWFG